jgi:DNA ligase-4
MILKSYAPVIIPPKHSLERFHFLLPHLLQFQNTFEGALEMLDQKPMKDFPPHPNPKLAASLCATALEYLQPRTGIKIGRPEYFKARGIKHCLSMANRRRMSVERKYDGEYCQIHVDLTDKRTPFRIFSKSGKESTEDRSGIFPSLAESLRIGSEDCRFSHRCILEGELVVWNDKRGEIAEFHKLRRFLSRSGIMIGIDNDSPYV